MNKVNDTILAEFLYFATTRCNCRCKHCNPVAYTGKNVEMSSRMMIELYEKSQYLQGNSISVAGGEPFLKEDLDEFIVYLDKKKIPCVISTNGWFTEKIEKLINKLEDSRTVRFAISIDGPEQMHEEIRKCKGIYQKALNSAQLLKDRGFDVQINMVVQKDNISLLEEFDNFFRSRCIPVIYIPKIFVGNEPFDFTIDDIKLMFQYITYPRGRKYLLSQGSYVIHNCHAGKNSWLIDCDGNVFTCCGGYYKDNQQEYIMGNLYNDDFDTIFTSEQKEKVYKTSVMNCEGCLLPRDIERETELFDYSTTYTREEIALLKDELCSKSVLEDFTVDCKQWYDLEKFNGADFRWMRSRKSYIYLNVQEKKPKKLIIHYLNGKPNEKDDNIQLTVWLNDKVVNTTICEEGVQKLEINVGNEQMKGDVEEISLEISKLWKPNDYIETADSRELGIGVFSVELQ